MGEQSPEPPKLTPRLYVGGIPAETRPLSGHGGYQAIPLAELTRMARANGQTNPLVVVAATAEGRTPAQVDAEQYYSLADGQLIIYPIHRNILLRGKMIRPKFTLFRGLVALAEHADKPVGREALAESMQDGRLQRFNPSTFKTYIKRIRALLEDLGHPEQGVIRAVKGVGYMALSSLKAAPLEPEAEAPAVDGSVPTIGETP